MTKKDWYRKEKNIMKETKDLFNKNYKPLKREIEEDIRR
jgi:hypothetical protein